MLPQHCCYCSSQARRPLCRLCVPWVSVRSPWLSLLRSTDSPRPYFTPCRVPRGCFPLRSEHCSSTCAAIALACCCATDPAGTLAMPCCRTSFCFAGGVAGCRAFFTVWLSLRRALLRFKRSRWVWRKRLPRQRAGRIFKLHRPFLIGRLQLIPTRCFPWCFTHTGGGCSAASDGHTRTGWDLPAQPPLL